MGAGQSKKKHNGKVAPLQDEKIDHHHPSRRFAHVKTDQLAAAHLVDHQRSAKDVSLQREREMEKQRNQAHPSFIGEYAVGRLMQQGTLGTFFEGTSRNSKERVCIKITEPSNLLFEALLQELEALRKLTPHPNIANILAVQQAGAGSSVEIVEERAAGLEVLDFILRRPAFCEREAALLSTQLLHALAHLHAQHLPHRGIKPDAVWIRPLPNSTAPPPKPAPAGLVNKSKSSPPSGPPEKDSPHPPVIPAFSFHVVLLDAGLASLKFKSRADLAPTHFSDPEFLAPELFTCSSSSSSYGASLSPRVARVEESRGGGGRGGEREGGEGGERGGGEEGAPCSGDGDSRHARGEWPSIERGGCSETERARGCAGGEDMATARQAAGSTCTTRREQRYARSFRSWYAADHNWLPSGSAKDRKRRVGSHLYGPRVSQGYGARGLYAPPRGV